MRKQISTKRIVMAVAVILLLLLAVRMCTFGPDYKDQSLLDLLIKYRAELEAPGLTVAGAAKNLKTPEAAYEFVRDRTLYSPYFGHRQSAETMLRTRSGNVLDRASLLAELLKAMGWKVTFYSVSDYAPFTDAPPSSGHFGRRGGALLKEISRRIGYDPESETADWQDMLRQLQQQAGSMQAKTDRVKKVLQDKSIDPYKGFGNSNPDEQRVYILATKDGEDQLYFNPTFPDMAQPKEGRSLYAPVQANGGIELWLRDQRGLEKPLMKWQGQTAGKDISLSFLPTHDPPGILNGPPDPNRVPMWTPMLTIEGQTISGRPFRPDGETAGIGLEPPSPDITKLMPFDPKAVTAMRLVDIDSSNFPQITLQLALDGVGENAMMPQHFQVTDNGRSVNVRLEKISYGGQAVSIVSDVSGSMKDIGAFKISQQAIIRLAGKLSPEIPVSLLSFAMSTQTEVALKPLGDGKAIRAAASGLAERDFTGIFKALNSAADQKGIGGGTIVLLTDGADNVGGSEAQTIKHLKDRNIRLIAIALGKNADHALISRIADATGGFSLKITKIGDLDIIYGKIGRFLSSYAALSYNAAPERTDDISRGNKEDRSRQLQVRLRDTEYQVSGRYSEPAPVQKSDPVLYAVFNGKSYGVQGYPSLTNASDRMTRRDIFRLDGPNIGYALAGQTQFYFDHGKFAPDIVAAAYITNWIEALRSRSGAAPTSNSEYYDRPSYDLVSTVNSIRTLSALGSGTGARLSGGINIYMKRSMVLPGGEAMKEHVVFDVVDRALRGYGAQDAGETFRLDVALNIAEGMLLGGENAVDALLTQQDNLLSTPQQEPSPDYWTGAMRELRKTHAGKDRYWLTAKDAPQWIWLADNNTAQYFAGFYLEDNGVMAKGASIESLAAQFDKIDKMYELYTKMAGKAPGAYASTGVLLGAIAAMKREENKLWCYSTLMLGYVNQAIDADDALLNKSPGKARASAAKLCKIKGSPDDFAKTVGIAVAKSLADAAKSWAQKPARNAIKDAATLVFGVDAGMLNDIKNNASDMATIANGLRSAASAPTTAGFHRAMAKAAGLTDH